MNSSTLATPRNPWEAYAVEIVDLIPEIPGVTTYALRFMDPAVRRAYACAPGRFNMLYLPGVGEAAISVSGHDVETDTWFHTVRTAGAVTRTLAGLGPGGKFALRGSFGTAWPVAEFAGRDVVFVAGGIGLAPLRPAIEWALQHRSEVNRLTLLLGARSPTTILFAEQIQQWRQRGLEVELTVDRAVYGWSGQVGVVTLLVDRLQPWNPQETVLLTCGPEVMMRYVARSALDRGLHQTQIWISLERNMQCAVGFCGHCQLGPAFICKDGPVFRHDTMAPYLGLEDF